MFCRDDMRWSDQSPAVSMIKHNYSAYSTYSPALSSVSSKAALTNPPPLPPYTSPYSYTRCLQILRFKKLSFRVTILPVFRFWEESETLTFCCHVNFSSSSSFILWLLTLCWCWHHWLSTIDVYKKYFCCTLNTLLKLLIWIVSPQLALVSECV